MERKMSSLILKSCCGCIGLKKGCLILGYVQLISTLLWGMLVLVTVSGGYAYHVLEFQGRQVPYLYVAIILLVQVFLLLTIIVNLLIGVHKNNSAQLRPFILLLGAMCAISIITSIVGLFGQAISFPKIISATISILMEIYFLLVVTSHFLTMDEGGKDAIFAIP